LANSCVVYDADLIRPNAAPAASSHKDAGARALGADAALDATPGGKLDAREAGVSEAGRKPDAGCGEGGVDCCPGDPRKTAPGQCGCGVADDDGDRDGTADCLDGCPSDPAKVAPGVCGCGGADTDSDGDGTADCKDGCIADGAKTAPGACGCGVPDVDANKDGTPDCVDGCPSDPMKTAPGVCGCGVADESSGTTVGCTALRNDLVHRFRFDGSGTSLSDSRGGSAGMVVSTQLNGAGKLDLVGTNQYADLPNQLVSGLTNTTIELWVTWNGGGAWQRIFDFGNNDSGTEGQRGVGTTYVYLTPSSSANRLQLAYSTNGNASEVSVAASTALPTGGMHHIAAVFDDTNNSFALYLDGSAVGSSAWSGSLSSIADINDWLGRSQFTGDPQFNGSLYELRIHKVALSAPEIGFSANAGPDPGFLNDL
jgi:hypothetical protein